VELYPKSPKCLHDMNTDTLAFLCAVTNYCEYLVKFTKVTVVVVDYPEIKVILIFKIDQVTALLL
jgi:hypothetical protein